MRKSRDILRISTMRSIYATFAARRRLIIPVSRHFGASHQPPTAPPGGHSTRPNICAGSPLSDDSMQRCSKLSSRRFDTTMRRRAKRPESAGWLTASAACSEAVSRSCSAETTSRAFTPGRSAHDAQTRLKTRREHGKSNGE